MCTAATLGCDEESYGDAGEGTALLAFSIIVRHSGTGSFFWDVKNA